MSLFGEALPYEDDTATSLIRRTGYPPEGKYVQMPENYVCPCCKEFSDAQERERLILAAQQEKDKEKRRLMQLDVFDERAKPLPTNNGNRRKIYRRVDEEDTLAQQQPEVPPPPPTLDELRRQKKQEASPAKLIVTVHYGKNLEAAPKDPMSVIVRCGAFEGQTAKVQRGKGNVTTWDELFEFPYPNPNESLEVLVVNDALPEANDHLLGGVVVPSNALHETSRGDEESLPVYPENEMQTAFDKSKEGPLGAVVVSWYVSEDGKEQLNESALDDQNLKQPLECVFVAHRVFQYTDNGSEPYPGGVLCVLRDTDDNCSDSILYTPGSNMEPSLSPYYGKEGYHYLPENPSQMMQLNTEKKLGHILICVPKQESAPNEEEEEELFVVGAVPIDFDKLYHKGSAVLLIESKSMDDALWGEISIEWLNRSLDSDRKPPIVDVDNESLYVTVVRGLNLTNGEKEPVKEAYVSVAAGEMEGITVSAPSAADAEQNNVITWNQEIRFIDVDPKENNLEVVAFENGNPVSTGHVVLDEDQDEGTVVIAMHDMFHDDDYRGEVIVNYKRLHVQQQEEEVAQHSDRDEQDGEEGEAAEGGNHASSEEDHNGAIYEGEDANQEDNHGGEQNENDEEDERESRDLKEVQSAQEEAAGDVEEDFRELEEQNDSSSAEEDKNGDHEDREDREDHKDHKDQLANEKNEEESAHHAGGDDGEADDDDVADAHNPDDETKDRDAADRNHEEQEEEADDHEHEEAEEQEDESKHADGDQDEVESDHGYENQRDADEDEDSDHVEAADHEDANDNASEGKDDEIDGDSKKDEEDVEDEYDEYHELYDKEKDPDNHHDEDDDGHDGHEANAEDDQSEKDQDEAHDSGNDDNVDGNDEEEEEKDAEKDNANRDDEDEYDAYHDRYGQDDPRDNEEYGDEDAHRGGSAENEGRNDESDGEENRGGEDNEESHDAADADDAANEHHLRNAEEDEADAHNQNRGLEEDQEEGAGGAGHEEDEQDDNAGHTDHDDEEAAHQEEPVYEEEEGDEGHPDNQLSGDERQEKAAEVEEHDVVDDNATDMALGDARRGKSPSKRPNWSDNRKSTTYKKPWYPAGQPTNENHLPYEKTKRSTSTRESIRNLEKRRTRLEEESVRRASTPRSSLSSPHLQQ